MLSARLSELAPWLGARLHGVDVTVTGVGNDTRRLQPGMLYVALRGEHLDGHAFLAQARPGDIVLVAGKGHEPYQEVAGRRLPFDDSAQVQSALEAWPC